MNEPVNSAIQAAAQEISRTRGLVIAAGAGMGVDSGLPDFRGPEGFWRAYPPYRQLGIRFEQAANPRHFAHDPGFAWGFYGHRLRLYRNTTPHPGFRLLLNWIERFSLSSFVITSNVDGQFQKAGFAEERVWEVHGSIHYLQCLEPCRQEFWPNAEQVPVDPGSMRARTFPSCRYCGSIARPNILMFGDGSWIGQRSDQQAARLESFLRTREGPWAVIEIGAGTAVPTIRHLAGELGSRDDARLIRINPREAEVAPRHISVPLGALEALAAIDKALSPA
jgi:NAD-dependent SIR2 family protein deacetylase